MVYLTWFTSLSLVGFAVFLYIKNGVCGLEVVKQEQLRLEQRNQASFQLPTFSALKEPAQESVQRKPSFETIIPDRPSQLVNQYTVKSGDSVFEIARSFHK
jgi:hypothetical protein